MKVYKEVSEQVATQSEAPFNLNACVEYSREQASTSGWAERDLYEQRICHSGTASQTPSVVSAILRVQRATA